jgi:hypothetical protein
MAQCPFLKEECIKKNCQLWLEAQNDCAIPQVVYTLNIIKEDHISELTRHIKPK